MHAYLLVGNNAEKLKAEGQKLAQKLKAEILEFPLAKIEDSRALKSFTALKVGSPTAVYINSIETATHEALNAFLKNLEEPQENLYFILTTLSLAAVLPTIVSRCEVIKLQPTAANPSPVPKLSLANIAKVTERKNAEELVQNLISRLHLKLLNNHGDRKKTAANLRIAIKTLNRLRANGNVSLQLTNMIVNLV